MNRVRELIGNRTNRGRRNNGNRDDVSNTTIDAETNRDSLVSVQINESHDFNQFDQQTIADGDVVDEDDGEDAMTLSDLQTFISESQTIGDLQTRGFVNRCPNFTSIRTIPFVSILLTRGFFAFSSDRSYNSFIANKRRLDDISLLEQGGVGIPLFHAVTNNVIKSLFGSGKQKSESVMKIFKYQIGDINNMDLSGFPGYETMMQSEGKLLIKFEFCQILKETGRSNPLEVIHTLNFYNNVKIKMINFSNKKDIDTNVDNLPLRWFGFSGFASPFGSNDIKLLVLDDDMPTFMHKSTQDNSNNNNTVTRNQTSYRTLGALPIWGRYSDINISMLPTKRTAKLAYFKIKENSPHTNNAAAIGSEMDTSVNDGITEVPEVTQILTCMCMLLHEYESRKERRHKNSTSDNAPLQTSG